MIYELNVRQLTPEGTFAAAEKHLPRLRELGIDAVWLMPIHADFNTGVYQGEYADALTGNRIVVPYRVEQDMAPWSYRILIRE